MRHNRNGTERTICAHSAQDTIGAESCAKGLVKGCCYNSQPHAKEGTLNDPRVTENGSYADDEKIRVWRDGESIEPEHRPAVSMTVREFGMRRWRNTFSAWCMSELFGYAL